MSTASNAPSAKWLLLVLLSNACFACYPVFSRYLQLRSHIGTFTLTVTANSVALLALVPYFLYATLYGAASQSPNWKGVMRNKWMPVVVILVVLRSVTLMLASRYATAVVVQVVALLVPFLVAFLARVFLKEHFSKFLIPAALVSTVGASLVIFGSASGTSSGDDQGTSAGLVALGFACCVLTVVFLSLYMVSLRVFSRSMGSAGESMGIMPMHYGGVIVTGLVLAAALGEFSQESGWGKMDAFDWLVFALFSIGVLGFANVAQVVAMRRVPAPVAASMLPFRLVIADVVSMLMLGEDLHSAVQIAGGVVIFLSTSTYLVLQARSAEKAKRQSEWKRLQAERTQQEVELVEQQNTSHDATFSDDDAPLLTTEITLSEAVPDDDETHLSTPKEEEEMM
eukprot:ANDGO_04657.mRNA.1 hypothetical protein